MAKKQTKTHFEVKNKVTGYIFRLPKDDVDKLIIEEPHNFEVIDKDYVKPVKEIENKTVYAQIVEEEKEEQAPSIVEELTETTEQAE